MTYPATNLNEAVGLIVPDSNALHDIVNGDASSTIILPEGDSVPTVRKAIADSLLFKDPLNWNEGSDETDYLQTRIFTDGLVYWAPLATVSNPIPMGVTPIGDSNWKLAPLSLNSDAIDQLSGSILSLEERLLEKGANVYPYDNIAIQDGDTIPVTSSPITHLRVTINSKVEIVSMYPLAVGVVSSLTENGAIIGGTSVKFYAPISTENIYQQSEYTNSLRKSLWSRVANGNILDFGAEYLTEQELVDIKINYSVGALDEKPTVDITQRLIDAIASVGGSSDITSAYLYEPAKVILLPAGAMGLTLDTLERILIDKNNVIIMGMGMFNTRLCHIGSGHANEMLRFKEAYACGLCHLTLDGGLPFNPVGTETYGVDIPLVFDQVAHFYAEGLNVCNYRHRGIQCIHLWESFLGDDLRCFNGGWFRVTGSAPGGLFFDDFRKESTFFSGSESNQVYIGKYAFSGNGSVYQFKSPCFNMRINQVVSEARTYSGYVPDGIDTTKVVVDGVSSGVVVDQAWYYFHDQDDTIPGLGATLFDFSNAGPGCFFNNQVVYQEIPSGSSGRALEVSKIIANSSAHPINLQLSLEDRNCETQLFNAATAGSLINAELYYRSDQVRTIDSILTSYGQTNMNGKITVSTGGFTTTPPYVVELGQTLSAIDGGGAFAEYKCRATSNFNGSTGTERMSKGLSVTKTGNGQYSYTFTSPMPDENYSITLGAVFANLGDNIEVGGMNTNGFSVIIRDAGGTFHDSPYVMASVFR